MRALLLALLAVVVLLAAAPAARAADRLDALAGQLREGPLAVDPELSWFFDGAQEARLARALEQSPVAFHVALLPHFEDDESGGDGLRIAVALHQRLRRAGLYLVIDQNGYLHARAYAVPRRITATYDLERPPVGPELDADEVIGRVERLVAKVAEAPPGTTTDDLPLPRLRGYREPYETNDTTTAKAALGSAAVFGILGVLAGGMVRLEARRVRRREAAQARAQAERERARRAAEAAAERRRRQRAKPRWRRFF